MACIISVLALTWALLYRYPQLARLAFADIILAIIVFAFPIRNRKP